MIIFKKVRFKNFLSYGNNFTEIDLNKDKTTLSVGKNGFGKSTFIDAITFALYGKPFRKVNKNQLINSINKSEMVTEIEFSVGSNNYKVVRGVKPNIFEVYCNESLLRQDAKVKDYQEQLERYILKMNYKSFTQVVILGSARYTPFMQLSAADRRSVIEDLLDIQIFSNMNSIVKDKLSYLKESIQDCKYNIELYKDKIDLQKHNINQNKKVNDDLILKKQELIANTELEIEHNNNLISSLNENISQLLSEISDNTSIESKKQKLLNIEFKLNGNISKLEKENQFFVSNNNCPTCKQIIDEAFKQSIIAENSNKIQELEQGNIKLQEELGALQNKLIKITSIQNLIANNNNAVQGVASENAMLIDSAFNMLNNQNIRFSQRKPVFS